MPSSAPFQNSVEETVFNLCCRSFLSLWSYPNPQRSPDDPRELCDILVVCDPHVIIFSVKEFRLKVKHPPEVMYRRWVKKAVKSSVDQLYGAQRRLAALTQVIKHDGSVGLPLPTIERRVVHHVSISLGAHGVFPFSSGDFGKGFVHVFDEEALDIAMPELDTITDFVEYLSGKEELLTKHPRLVIEGGEKNLLSVFLENGRAFPNEAPPPILDSENWERFSSTEAFRLKKAAERESYAWDGIIEWLSGEVLADRMEGQATFSEQEQVLRHMARTSRLDRVVLVRALTEFRQLAADRQVSTRLCAPPSGVAFLFFNPRPDQSREDRKQELALRCFVARDLLEDHESHPRCETVVGIGTNIEPAEKGFSTDLALVSVSTWTAENRAKAAGIKNDLGYFKEPNRSRISVEEYPSK